jgi:phage tail tape-measure protein
MALPPNASAWTQEMDPADIVDYQVTLAGTGGLLETGETIASYTLTMSAEGAALGVTIGSVGSYAPSLINSSTGVKLWLSVGSGFQSNAAFSGTGVSVGIELTVVTNSSPARTRQRTLVVKVAQQ